MKVNIEGVPIEQSPDCIIVNRDIEIGKSTDGVVINFEDDYTYIMDLQDARDIIKGLELAIKYKWLDNGEDL
jgi:hypothetical protein